MNAGVKNDIELNPCCAWWLASYHYKTVNTHQHHTQSHKHIGVYLLDFPPTPCTGAVLLLLLLLWLLLLLLFLVYLPGLRGPEGAGCTSTECTSEE